MKACRLIPAFCASISSWVLSAAGNFKLVGLLSGAVVDMVCSGWLGSQISLPPKFTTTLSLH
jgi:hypothetical protein